MVKLGTNKTSSSTMAKYGYGTRCTTSTSVVCPLSTTSPRTILVCKYVNRFINKGLVDQGAHIRFMGVRIRVHECPVMSVMLELHKEDCQLENSLSFASVTGGILV